MTPVSNDDTTTAASSTTTDHLQRQQQQPTLACSSSSSSTTLQRQSTVRQAAAVTTDVTRRMICGGLAGMIAKTATNPLDRIRMLSQTGEHGGKQRAAGGGAGGTKKSVYVLYRDILRTEGVAGLWAGNGANLLRVFPAKAVVFSSNDMYKNMLNTAWSKLPWWTTTEATTPTPPPSGPLSFVAGGFAGMTASAVTYPLDLARGRISGKLAAAAGEKTYSGIWTTLRVTVADEGITALYRGITPTLLGAMPYEGIKFGTVGLLESIFPLQEEDVNDGCSTDAGAKKPQPSPIRKMMFGGAGGVMAGTITYPNDTVRRLLQLQGSRGTGTQYAGYWDCAVQTYKKHGVSRFYRGLGINIVRMAPNTAVQFGSYELLKQWTS